MLIFTHVACLGHDPGPDHPESPLRLQVVLETLRAHFADRLKWQQAPAARLGELARVHSPALIDDIMQPQTVPWRRLDPDTFTCPHSAQAALHAAGSGIAAVDAVLSGSESRAFCAVRPPGHHASADTAMGFCLFSNIAIAAAHALEHWGLQRVAIVDFDVHHGNGTQAMFADEARIAYYSSHQSHLFPFSGHPRERGVGNIHNRLLPPGADGLHFCNLWADDLLPRIDDFAPQLLLVSAGFDAHVNDPQADLMVETADFAWLTTELRKLADRHAGGRLVSMLEGGYDLDALRECTVAHVGALLEDSGLK